MNSKAGRLIDEYDRSGLGDQLIDAWTGEGDGHQSL